MKTQLFGAVGALTLTLALGACQQPAEPEAPAADATGVTEAEGAAGPMTAPGAAPAESMDRAPTTGGGAAAAPDATEPPPPGDGMMSGPSPSTRDMAKEKAEQTNLHPRTP